MDKKMEKIFVLLFSIFVCATALFSFGCGKNQDNNSGNSSANGTSNDREVGVEWDEENWD